MSVYTKRPGFPRETSSSGYIDPTDFSRRVDINAKSQFGEVVVVERTPIIELNSSYGTSVLRDIETVTGSGSISAASSGEILLSTGTTASSSADLDSAEVGRYVPGYGAEIGIGVRIPTAPTGNQKLEWGAKDSTENNGFNFGYDATGLYIAYLSGGTDNKTYQTNWNIDKLDGTGPSGFNLDVSNGHIYQINYTWYGYGIIQFSVNAIVPDKNSDGSEGGWRPEQKTIPCHYIKVDGNTSIQSPNLRLHAEANNGGDASDIDLYVGGRQYSVVGRYQPKFRTTGDVRGTVSVSTTKLPLISFRTKSAFSDRSIKIEQFGVVNNGTNDVFLNIVLDGTLTGASFTAPTGYTASETAVEVDKSATAISGGTTIYGGIIVPAGSGRTGSQISRELDFDIPDGSTITLCATSFSGSNDVKSSLIMREEW